MSVDAVATIPASTGAVAKSDPSQSKRRFAIGSGFVNRTSPTLRKVILALGRGIGKLFLDVRIENAHNLPRSKEALIVISNHFGWFDAFILTLFLPFQPVFIVATESQRMWYVRFFMNLFDGIPIWRGQVDRDAFRGALKVLEEGRSIGVFPEGGINPDLAERVAAGEMMTGEAPKSRVDGKLVRAKPGTALLATMSARRILPIALLGTDRIANNLRRLRRSTVRVRVGRIFGPVKNERNGKGQERRQRVDQLADEMMAHVAAMFPRDKRGPYAGALPEGIVDQAGD